MGTIPITLGTSKRAKKTTPETKLEVRQGTEGSWELDISIVDGTSPYDLTGKTVRLTAKLPNGSVVSDTDHVQVVSAANGKAKYTFHSSLTSCVGVTKPFIDIYSGDDWIDSTDEFSLYVTPRPDVSAPEAQSYVSEITAARAAWLEQTEEQQETFEANEASRETAETARDSAEAERVAAEASRVSAEASRVSAEEARETAEDARETASATAVSNANAAAETATEAAATALGNTLKGTKRAEVVRVFDAYPSPLDEAKIFGNAVQTGTPSPTTPAPITVVEDPELEVRGKNLLPSASASSTVNGVTFTVNEDGSITANGTATADAAIYLRTENNRASIRAHRAVMLSGCPAGGGSTTYRIFAYPYTGGTYDNNYILVDNGSGATKDWTTVDSFYGCIKVFSGTTVNNLVFRPQLELGSTATAYEPYTGTSTAITLPDAHDYMASLQDGTRDVVTLDADGKKLLAKTKKVTFDGSEDEGWVKYASYENVFTSPNALPEYFNSANSSNAIGMYFSDGYQATTVASFANVSGYVFRPQINGANTKRVYFINEDITLLDDFIASLAANPVTVIYKLATPVEYDLTGITIPSLPDSTSTVYTDAEVPCETEITYVRDVTTAMDALEASDGALYGVRFAGGSNNGERLYDARGMVAGVGTDTETAVNDFDTAPIYGAIRPVNRVIDSSGASIRAVMGDADFTRDGTNGDVQVEIPLFYYKIWTDSDGYECWAVSETARAGYSPSPMHVRPNGSIMPKAYVSAYKGTVVNNVLRSVSGVQPTDSQTMAQFLAAARSANEGCCTTTNAERMTRAILAVVEFATRDVQSVMSGFSTGIYAAGNTATEGAAESNTVTLSAANAAKFVVGQTINICTDWITVDNASKRKVTAIDGGVMTFDGDPVDIMTGMNVYNLDWANGATDSVLTPSGSPGSNSSGKYPCRYRYIEGVWGGGSEVITGMRTNRSAETPYTYDMYEFADYCDDSGANTIDGMVQVASLPVADGYIKSIDAKMLPAAVGGSSSTFESDYYWYPRSAVCVPRLGLVWAAGAFLGAFPLDCNFPASYEYRYRLARLSTPVF